MAEYSGLSKIYVDNPLWYSIFSLSHIYGVATLYVTTLLNALCQLFNSVG